MNARRKITEEAEKNEQSEEPADDHDEADDRDDQGETEREQLTQRMPEDLVSDVDELADRLGMSRNAAINMLVEQGLDQF